MYTQTDVRWRDDSMYLVSDKLWRWGCLVTCIANIITDKIKVKVNPGQLNKQLKENGGYVGSKYPGQESCLNWSALIALYGFYVDINMDRSKYEEVENKAYIAMVIHPLTHDGHFINIIKKNNDNTWTCFDVEDGKNKIYSNISIKKIICIEV